MLMTLVFTRKGENEETHVFSGAGSDEEEAKRSAALNALLMLETF